MSTEPEVPPLHVRMTGLNVDQLSAIGFITVSWNALERMVEFCIWAAAGWDDDVGGIVTTDLQNVSRKTLAQNLIHLRVTDDPTLLEDAEVAIAFFDAMRTRRNDLVHGLPLPAIDLPMPSTTVS